MGRTGHTAATDANGVSLYSDVHYLETYKVTKSVYEVYLKKFSNVKCYATKKALEEMYKEGKIKNIGVSNFNIRFVDENEVPFNYVC